MDKTLTTLLGDAGLPKEITQTLQEAFDKKVLEARQEAEMALREEFSRRYENDKSNLVEAMDRMLTDVVSKQEETKAEEIGKLTEARDAFHKAAKDARQNHKNKLREHLSLTRRFANEQLVKEASALRAEKKKLSETRAKIVADMKALKENLANQQKNHIKKIDEFVVRQVGKELTEFGQDQRALVETRVKLVTEGRKRLKEMQTKFIKASASKVEVMVNESLKREMSQLHEDLERNRENMFGRRIFEAVAAEYMTSYLAEGTELRKLKTVLESKDSELKEAKAKLNEVEQKSEISRRKAVLAEERATRSQIMNELLSNLRGEKRTVMEGMLETTKTANLRTAFNKLLPVVLNENSRKSTVAPQGKKLMEEDHTVTHTGDRMNRLFETVQAESENETANNQELAHVVRLAGIK